MIVRAILCSASSKLDRKVCYHEEDRDIWAMHRLANNLAVLYEHTAALYVVSYKI